MSQHDKELLVAWIFAAGWLVLLAVGVAVAWTTARRPNKAYRGFVPLIGLVTAFLLAGSIALGSAYFPK